MLLEAARKAQVSLWNRVLNNIFTNYTEIIRNYVEIIGK